jgi:RimJ/RimL family protein N-acetyltransferase
MRLQFVAYDRRFLLASRTWLRDPEIAALTMTPAFTDEGQERWFAELPSKTDYLVWGVELQSQPVGVIGLKRIQNRSAEYFGYLGEKAIWGQGYGSEMVETALAAAKARGCSVVSLRVWRDNPRAISLYRRLGFELVGEKGSALHMERHV